MALDALMTRTTRTLFAVDVDGGSDHYLDGRDAEDAVCVAITHDAADDAVVEVDVVGETWTARVDGRPRKGRVVGVEVGAADLAACSGEPEALRRLWLDARASR